MAAPEKAELNANTPFRYQTVFISDAHLGSNKTASSHLYEFLSHLDPDALKNLYIVGDLIGGWEHRAGRQQPIPEMELRIFDVLNALADYGIKIHYIPGNHDEKLRPLIRTFNKRRDHRVFHKNITMARQCDFQTEGPASKTFTVTHGDDYEPSLFMAWWVKPFIHLISNSYDLAVKANYRISNFLYRHYHMDVSVAKHLKAALKKTLETLFTNKSITKGLKRGNIDGIVMGHTHVPGIQKFTHKNGKTSWLINDGDWVEGCAYAATKKMDDIPFVYDYKKERERIGFGDLPDVDDRHSERFLQYRDMTKKQIRYIHRLWPARNHHKHIGKLDKARRKLSEYSTQHVVINSMLATLSETRRLTHDNRIALASIFNATDYYSYAHQKSGLKRIFNQYSPDTIIHNEDDVLFIKTVLRDLDLRCDRKLRKHESALAETRHSLDRRPKAFSYAL